MRVSEKRVVNEKHGCDDPFYSLGMCVYHTAKSSTSRRAEMPGSSLPEARHNAAEQEYIRPNAP